MRPCVPHCCGVGGAGPRFPFQRLRERWKICASKRGGATRPRANEKASNNTASPNNFPRQLPLASLSLSQAHQDERPARFNATNPPEPHKYIANVGIMIRFFLLQNKTGVARLRRWYVDSVDEDTQAFIESEIHRQVTERSRSAANFFEFAFRGSVYIIVYRR